MKKLLIISSFIIALCISAIAQTSVTTSMTNNGSTLTNAGSDTVYTQIQGTYKTVSVQAVLTKVSGTVAGNAVLFASVDGTNYVQISTDSLLMTNQTTNTKIWVVNNSNYMYYKVIFTGVGTMVGTAYGYVFGSGQIAKHATSNMLSSTNQVTSTVTNAGSGYVALQVKNGYTTVTIQAVVTKATGTAAGTVTLQGSVDGVNYVTVSSSYSDAQTLSVADQTTNTKIFTVTGSPYSYYKLNYVGSGTMSCTVRGYLLPNK